MKILLIDDSRVTRYALRIELKSLGMEVDTAESAETALATLKERVPDAILVDHIMPGLNGLEALEIIRADPRTAHIPIVLCTSREDIELAAAARRKGVLTVLPKSRAVEQLPEVIARIRSAIDSGMPAAPDSPEASPEPGSPSDPIPEAAESDWTALIDGRLEVGINKRLTVLIEELRRDLTELLTVETRHAIEAHLARERAAAAPAARLEDLQALEARLLEHTLPDLVSRCLADALARQPGIAQPRAWPQPGTLSAGVGGGPEGPREWRAQPCEMTSADPPPGPEVMEAASRLRTIATTALQSLRAAIRRQER